MKKYFNFILILVAISFLPIVADASSTTIYRVGIVNLDNNTAGHDYLFNFFPSNDLHGQSIVDSRVGHPGSMSSGYYLEKKHSFGSGNFLIIDAVNKHVVYKALINFQDNKITYFNSIVDNGNYDIVIQNEMAGSQPYFHVDVSLKK